jgi:hypothetical protein
MDPRNLDDWRQNKHRPATTTGLVLANADNQMRAYKGELHIESAGRSVKFSATIPKAHPA